jgi:hypothetical protein
MSPWRSSSRRAAFVSASPFAAMSLSPHGRWGVGGVFGVVNYLGLAMRPRADLTGTGSESLSPTHGHDITFALPFPTITPRPLAAVSTPRELPCPTCVQPAFWACREILILPRIKPPYTLYGRPPECLPHSDISLPRTSKSLQPPPDGKEEEASEQSCARVRNYLGHQ